VSSWGGRTDCARLPNSSLSSRAACSPEPLSTSASWDVATQLQVFRFVDDTHASAPDLAEEAVMGNHLPHGLRRSGHWHEWYE
jgi:hypothetical protein